MLNNIVQTKRNGKIINASGIVIASVAAVILLALLITYVTNSDRYGSLSDFVTDMVHLAAFRIEYSDSTGYTDDAQRPCSLAQKWALYTFTD